MRYLFAIIPMLLFSLNLSAQKTESPYLEILSPDAVIPLKESRADVQLSGSIAHVQITQVYHNEGKTPLEAKYVFPLSIRAAVHKMQMRIGERTINAKIYEKQEAQQVYQQALSDGKRAAKLDQERPNVFQMNVGNIMPGDEIAVELSYTEMLVPVNGDYQFVFPGVVGPRFTGEDRSGAATFQQGYTAQGKSATFAYGLNVALNAGMIIQQIHSSSHQIDIHYPDPLSAEISLKAEEKNPGNRDFILNYSLRGSEIQSGLLLYEGEKENFFAYLMEPVKAARPEQIPPRDYLFIVDVSGSMNGYPLEISKKLLQNLLCSLRETDEFNILLFAGSSSCFRNEPVPAKGENIEAALHFLSSIQGGGGTQFLSALNQAYSMPKNKKGTARSMVVITDGYISVEREAFELIRNNLDRAGVYSFGIGTSVNRYLIEGMAMISQTEAFIATTEEEALRVAKQFENYIATPLLTQIKFSAEGFEVYDVEPASIPDVTSARPVVVYGKWKGKPQGKLVVNAYLGDAPYRKSFSVADGTLSKANQALKYLWARKKIERLDDYHQRFQTDVKQEVIDLGLQYNLATRFTSFVAVDDQVVNADGEAKLVHQPLPMPQGVSDMAVGAEAEVKEKTEFVKSYTLLLQSDQNKLTKAEERNLKMWFRNYYSKLVQELLIEHGTIRLHLDQQRRIVSVEIYEEGTWVSSTELKKAFLLIPTESAVLADSVTIMLEQ
jgi:Ca-activated chloride channel family protein